MAVYVEFVGLASKPWMGPLLLRKLLLDTAQMPSGRVIVLWLCIGRVRLSQSQDWLELQDTSSGAMKLAGASKTACLQLLCTKAEFFECVFSSFVVAASPKTHSEDTRADLSMRGLLELAVYGGVWSSTRSLRAKAVWSQQREAGPELLAKTRPASTA